MEADRYLVIIHGASGEGSRGSEIFKEEHQTDEEARVSARLESTESGLPFRLGALHKIVNLKKTKNAVSKKFRNVRHSKEEILREAPRELNGPIEMNF